MRKSNNFFLKRIGLWILKSITTGLILCLTLYMTLTLFFEKSTIQVFGFQHFVIVSSSMDPTIKVGDVIVIKKVNFETLEVGDIITFYVDADPTLPGKEIVTHYLHHVDSENNLYYSHREGTTTPDSWSIEKEDIIGTYVFKVDKIGKLFLFFQTGLGRVVFVLDGVILFSILMILWRTKDENETEEKISEE